MAYGDYQHCAKCDAKTFYDANVEWGSMYVPNDGYSPDDDAIKSLCVNCAATHEVVCVARGELDATRAALAEARAAQPSAAEMAALKLLRELRASPAAGGIAKWLRKRAEPVGNLRATLLMQGLAALLAPESEAG